MASWTSSLCKMFLRSIIKNIHLPSREVAKHKCFLSTRFPKILLIFSFGWSRDAIKCNAFILYKSTEVENYNIKQIHIWLHFLSNKLIPLSVYSSIISSSLREGLFSLLYFFLQWGKYMHKLYYLYPRHFYILGGCHSHSWSSTSTALTFESSTHSRMQINWAKKKRSSLFSNQLGFLHLDLRNQHLTASSTVL